MIALLRILILVPIIILLCIVGCLFCLIRPFHRNNTFVIAGWLSSLAPLFGIKLEIRIPKDLVNEPTVFIGNHQNTFDVVTISGAVQQGTVSVGKKSLKWVPFFGQLYWLSGNIMIDRKNKTKAVGTIKQTADRMIKDKLSIWMFPEGTRNKGDGLLPFKTGAFHTAIQAQVPVVPVVLSDTSSFHLNRWNNGHAIAEMMEPIDISDYKKSQARELSVFCHDQMSAKLNQLNSEVEQLNKA